MGKKRDKASIERERREEQERIGRERWSKRRAEMLKAKAAAAAAAAEAAKQCAATQEVPIPPVVEPDKVNIIRDKLIEIYKLYCPTKVDKIDKLLHRYHVWIIMNLKALITLNFQDREEEFIEFVINKYNVQEEHLKYTSPVIAIVENGKSENDSNSSPRVLVPDPASSAVLSEEGPVPILPKTIPNSASSEEDDGSGAGSRRRQKSVPAPARDNSQQVKIMMLFGILK